MSLAAGAASIPDSLVLDGIPAIPDTLRQGASRYLEFRTAAFLSWHPKERSILVGTRFADTPQLHWVSHPGGARKQLTFSSEPIRGGAFRPHTGECILYTQDSGGGEFFQLYRYDLKDGRSTLLTDGKSRYTGVHWSHSGRWIAYSSTERNGKDTDLYVMNPDDPKSAKRVLEVVGGGWTVEDWSWDDQQLLVGEHVSINESWLYRLDLRTGTKTPLYSNRDHPAAYGNALFDHDSKIVYWTTDRASEFQQLFRVDTSTGKETLLTGNIPWDIENVSIAPNSSQLGIIANENGSSVAYVLDGKTGKRVVRPLIPSGVISGLNWHESGREIGFTLSSARSPSDAYSFDVRSGAVTRWTESETGGVDASRFAEPELVQVKSFDGLSVSGFLYRPDAKRFPGRRPIVIVIHGGPEGQSQPTFLGRQNFLLEELGVAVLLPNVRGSSGYGKTFLTLDNGFKREDSVRDIGAFLDWIQTDSKLDAQRVAVMGGSYGGYMVLACMTHYSDRLRCGVDIVGISNFLTFLKNTQDYRRDLRRVEYGDERDPKMAEFLQSIAPAAHADKIRKPLFVVQGKNDPRVPLSESEQMVKAIRDNGGAVWYLMAKDEGHGFGKKKNVDFQFLATLQFFQEYLLKP